MNVSACVHGHMWCNHNRQWSKYDIESAESTFCSTKLHIDIQPLLWLSWKYSCTCITYYIVHMNFFRSWNTFKLVREVFDHGGDVWFRHKKSENQNIKIGPRGGWSTKITYIKDYVQNFKVLHEELNEQWHFEGKLQNQLALAKSREKYNNISRCDA